MIKTSYYDRISIQYCGVTVHRKATEQYYTVVMFRMSYKVVLTFESVYKILKCDHSLESYWAVLPCGAVSHVVQGGSKFESVDEILKCDRSNESYWEVLSWGAGYFSAQGVLRLSPWVKS